MESWVYVLSRFTPEALFFEALVLFILLSGYSAFWILRKRRFGINEQALPSGAVRAYLNELITNAEQLRLQLFGLIASSEASNSELSRSIAAALQGGAGAGPAAAMSAAGAGSNDPGLTQKLQLMESRMAEQAQAIESITVEKKKLVEELTAARAQASQASAPQLGPDGQPVASPDGGGGASQAQIDELNKKIADLEARLAEYNVIEDDLANLKRLQQENAQLKKLLAEKGGSVEQLNAAAAETPVAETPVAETPVAEKPVAEKPAAPTSPTLADELDAIAAAPIDVPAPAVGGAPASGATSTDPAAAAAPAATADAAADPANPAAPAAITAAEPSEADLVAEFEKMLKG